MKKLTTIMLIFTVLTIIGLNYAVGAEKYEAATVGVWGYDLVSYHTLAKPVRGNGNHVSEYQDTTYLFSSEDNKKEFEKNPGKYVPAYGGYCAFGVAVGKKFYADPDEYEIVDSRLYLNLDNKIKKEWREDIPGNIKKADANWKKIKDKAPKDL